MKALTTCALLWLLALVPALAQTFEMRPVPAFTAIEVSSGVELNLTSGPAQRVQAEADDSEALEKVKTEVVDGVLKVTYDQSWSWWGKKSNKHPKVNVTAAGLTGLEASSGSSVKVAGTYSTTSMKLGVSSGASMRATFQANVLDMKLSSGASAHLSGRAQRFSATASSGATLNAQDLTATACEASASSGASMRVGVRSSLVAQASSGGSVRYEGSPEVRKQTSSGGSVTAM